MWARPIQNRPVDLHVTLSGRGDLAARIYRELLAAIRDGRLRPGERLPPTRDLARRLGVARQTVTVAYERLAGEGFVDGRVGSGTFVTTVALAAPSGDRRAPSSAGVRARSFWEALSSGAPGLERRAGAPPRFDFRVGSPDARLFPMTAWRRLVSRELRPSALLSAAYGDPAGHPGLRAAIARHVGISRAVRASADDVLVTRGAQHAFDLIGRVLIEPGCCVAVEDPGYPPVRQLFASLGARVVGVAVDTEGLDVAAIPRSARLVYVTPSHQFPLGVAMSLARRLALLDWAERRDGVVVEDDYDSEFRFGGRPLDPLQSLDRSGRVVYVGSFSKVLLPGLRLGFAVAPASLQPALRAARRLTDWYGEGTAQGALARFIDEGLLASHVKRCRRDYAARHERIAAALSGELAPFLEGIPSAAGLHVAARLVPGGADLGDVLRRAAESGLALDSLEGFGVEGPAPPGLAIGFGSIAASRIPEGLRRLRECFRARPRG